MALARLALFKTTLKILARLQYSMPAPGTKNSQPIRFIITNFVPFTIVSNVQPVIADASECYVNLFATACNCHFVLFCWFSDFGFPLEPGKEFRRFLPHAHVFRSAPLECFWSNILLADRHAIHVAIAVLESFSPHIMLFKQLKRIEKECLARFSLEPGRCT